MKISFNPSNSNKNILDLIKNNKDIIFDLKGHSIFARGVKFYGTDTWRDIKINNVSIGSNTLDLRNGSNTTLTNTNGVVTINSTWRPVVDNLTSDSTTSSLSAKQGKVLKSLIDGKSNSGHTHDDRYLKLTGGTMTSNALITFADSGSQGTDKGPQGARGGLYWTGQSDYAKLYAEETAGDNLDLVIKFGDDNSNGLSIRNKANTQTSYISAGGVITTGTFKGNLDWSYITNKPSSYTPSAHTHAWNSLTHSSTTENQAILTNGKANGWKLYTLNISRWDNAANNAHSHSNKSVLDGITSGLVNNWNIAYTFVNTITGTDTDKVINKWDEIVNFLAGITEDNKLNTLLNSKLSVYELANNTNVGTIKNNGIYYSTTDASSGTLTNSPFNTGFALINMTSYNNGGDDLRRSRLAFNTYGEIKVSDDRDQANTAETWYNVLTSKNSGISGSTIKLNGTSITVYSSSTADGRYVKKSGDTMSGVLTIDTTNFGALTIKRNDDANGVSIQFRGKSSVYGYIGLNNSTKDKQFLRWSSDTYKTYTILDTSSTYTSNGKGVINGTTITQVDNATNSTNSTNARKLVNWYSARPTSLNTQFGDGSLRIFHATPSTTEGKCPDDATVLHLAWDNNGGYDAQLALAHENNNKIYFRSQRSGTWKPWKTLAFTTDIPSSLKNPHALTISLNGTSQGPYDGSAAKNVNITPGSIGAAVSNHSHDYLVVNAADDKSFNSAYHNFQVLYAGGGNGITGKPANVDSFGLFKFRTANGWSGQMLLASGGSLYIRAGEDAKITNTLAWKTILDSSNYSGILDSRYYTESEINTKLGTYLPLAGGTMTGNIKYIGKGTSYIGNGENDAANGVGGALNNLVISSWYGVSFTTSCSGYTYTNKNAVSINCRNGYVYANTFVGTFNGNASTATKLTSSAGNVALPIYFSDGKPVACTASQVFSNLSNSGNDISITVAGQNRKLTVGYASNADMVDGTHLNGIFTAFGNDGNNISATVGTITKKFEVKYSHHSYYSRFIKGDDQRNANNAPSYYMNTFGKSSLCTEVSQQGKQYGNGTYVNLITSIPWNDPSGGRPVQLAIGNHIGLRSATNDSTWGAWKTIPTIDASSVMEIGKFIDWHWNNEIYGSQDFSTRLQAQNTSSYPNTIYLPTQSGELALLDQVELSQYHVVDMRNYDSGYWHPVTVGLPKRGYNKIKVSVELNIGDKPSWATHDSGFTCNMEIWAEAHGWGTTNAETICLNYTYSQCNSNPCGWMQLGYPSLGVLFLRGGARYKVWTDFDAAFTPHDKTYTWTSGGYTQSTGGPYTSCPGLNFNKNRIYANLDGTADNADKLDGYHASYSSSTPWGTIPVITTTGWMDIGKHLEFHHDNTTGSDYSTLLTCTGNYSNIVNLPSESGTLALTKDVLTFTIDTADYLSASFNNPDFSKKAASQYIECWDGAGGWWNWRAGKFMKAGSSDAYVLLGGGGHKPLSEFQLGSGSYLPYNGWWANGSGQDVNNANGMIFAYANHKNSPFSSAWGIITTFDYTYNSDYKFQLAANCYSNAMYYRSRSNERGGWASWAQVIDTGNIGSQRVAYATSAGSVAWSNVTGKPSSLKNPYSLNVFGVAYDGSAAKTVTTSTFISQLSEGTSTVTDGTMFITSYASNSGFADTNAVNVPYKRKASCLWSYIDSKVSSKYLPLAGGTMNGNARIGHGSGNLYIGNSGNDGWIYTQDIASQLGTDKWAISQSGAARFGFIHIASTNDNSLNRNLIESDSGYGIHLNYVNNGNVTLCNGGGNVGIGTSSPAYKLDVKGQAQAEGFRHSSHNSNDAVLLAGGSYKTLNSIYGGDSTHLVFLGSLNLVHGSDGTISSTFPCLGYSVPFTYTRGGNYCKISIPNTTHQVFYIKAAIASVNYSGGGIDNWTGEHRGDGAWWLHCYASGNNDVRVKGFRNSSGDNDSWWGGNPLYSGSGSANIITVCLFGYVDFR